MLQGFGWEIGAQAAREGIDAVREARQREERGVPPGSPRARPVSLTSWAEDERRLRKLAARQERQQRVAAKKRLAKLDAELRELKRKARES
jgi:hypothetical protein